MSHSQATTTGRSRLPRFAEAAVERARLTVVPPRALGRSQAARTPFAVLVLLLLAGGVVGLLMFNTHMQQTSFTATRLQDEVDTLTAQKQSLALELDGLRDPQHLGAAAQALGMVAPPEPAFVRLSDGAVLGNPTPATSADSVQITPGPSVKPPSIERRTVIVEATPEDQAVRSKRGQDAAQGSTADTPATSTDGDR
ncbi:hypothetical protein SAMN04488570_0080 [Nocardioides scoriae]|uniref:Cell division protein FtsL n=1 Tax=Nocardioides scoriae TaxID=642780 RepID=A0A1H1L8H8_9ACTN|nr:hypothetical protein [Nocardioides scoriae]SDR70365.1 hypothetical protein SAMN04488570_0080 [Nocardioides scoriae]